MPDTRVTACHPASFARAGKRGFLTLASLGVSFRVLPLRAKSWTLLYGDTRRTSGRLDLPLVETLAAAGQEDGHGIGRTHHALAQLEEALDQLHGLDIRHGGQDRAPKTLPRGTEFVAPGQRVERLG